MCGTTGRGRSITFAAGEHASAVDVLHELLDVVVGRVHQDVLGGADLHDAAVAHHSDPVAEEHGLVQVVRDEDDRLLQLLLQFEQLLLHLATDQRVERTECLVHQQDVAVGGERTGDPHALLHATGKLGRELLALALETHQDRISSALARRSTLPTPFSSSG